MDWTQYPVQRKYSVILAPFPETIGYIFPPKNCWLETTAGSLRVWMWLSTVPEEND